MRVLLAIATICTFTMAAPSSTDSVAVYDGSTASSISANIVAELAPPAQAIVDFATLYEIGVLTWNKSAAEDAEKAILAQDLLYSKDLANAGSATTRWIGFGLEADGTSQWVYPVNQTGYEPCPKVYNGNVTTGSMYEESVHGSDAICPNGVRYCLRDFWFSDYGKPIAPAIGHYAPYDPRTRAFYIGMKNLTRGAQTRRWTAGFRTWLQDVVITADAALFDSPNVDERDFVGVALAGVSIADMGNLLNVLAPSGTVTFVMDKETGMLQFSSIPGACGQLDTSTTHGSWTAYLAENSTSDLIAASAAFLSRSVPDVNPVLWEGYWIRVDELREIGGLALENPWLIVVLELACPFSGTFFKRTPSSSGSITASDATEANSLGDCTSCPFGMTCMGGLALPFPNDGYWADVSSIEALADDAMACLAPENCRSARLRSCFSSLGNFTACVASEDFEDLICAEGSEGRLCAICLEGYYYEEKMGCRDCAVFSIVGSLVVFLVIVAVVAAVLVVLKFFPGLRSSPWWVVVTNPARFKIVWATAQIVGTISWSTGVSWPEPFHSMSWFFSSVFSLNFFTLMPTACWGVTMRFYSQVLIATIAPFAAVALIGTVSLLKGVPIISRGSAIYATQLILFCVLPSTSLILFRVFDCLDFEDGSSWLAADLTESCDSATYDAMVTYTCFALVVYPLGIPLYFFVTLYQKKDAIRDLDRRKPVPPKLRKYEFLFTDYSSEFWYGEVVRSVMRVLLSGLVVTFSSSSVVRSFWGIILSFVFVEVTREYQLFLQVANNAIATAAQYQIFFTYSMAFILIARPFNSDNSATSTLLLFANLAVFVKAFLRAKREFDARQTVQQLQNDTLELAKELESFQKSMLNIVTVSRSLGKDPRTALPSKGQILEVAKTLQLDLTGVNGEEDEEKEDKGKEDELRNYVEMAVLSRKKGEIPLWYWGEDPDKIQKHKPSEVWDKQWVKYADIIVAQLEKFYLEKEKTSGMGIVDVDVQGRVTSTESLGKEFRAETGTKYRVDLNRMVQINAMTGYERPVLRRVINSGGGASDVANHAWLDEVERTLTVENEGREEERDSHIPNFPEDLIDKHTGEPTEPLLCLHVGQLIQTQKKRDDGWEYGFVIYDPRTDGLQNQDDADGSSNTRASKLRKIERERKKAQDDIFNQAVLSFGSIFGGASRNKYRVEEDTTKTILQVHQDENIGFTSGWFPNVCTRMPTPLELADMQASLYPTAEASTPVVIDRLAPPDHWASKDNPDPLRPLLVDLDAKDEERVKVEDFFKASLHDTKPLLKRILSVKRIESIGLWQSFVAKNCQLQMRAKAEGYDDAYAEAYEKVWMFHGTSPEVIPKICSQGFNRSFCGRNAVKYGKGVYFATTSWYSNNYSMPDSKGVKRIFLSRVAVGEYCVGKDGQTVPDERKTPWPWAKNRHILYDSTTDTMQDNQRHMFVVYHDAQAYPEYLIEYSLNG